MEVRSAPLSDASRTPLARSGEAHGDVVLILPEFPPLLCLPAGRVYLVLHQIPNGN